MRITILKKNSTKAERRFYEVLKELGVPFQHRVKIGGKEIDFLLGKYAIEINGHPQDTDKNEKLAQLGLIPVHVANKDTRDKSLIINLIKQCL
jgi:hypothetical protein